MLTKMFVLSALVMSGSAHAAPEPGPLRARFVPVEIGADVTRLPASERQVLVRLIRAAKLVDALYLRQVWAGNAALLLDLAQDESALGRARLGDFLVMKSPWDNLRADAPFLPGVPPRPPQGDFYPGDATRAEVEAWFGTLTGAAKAAATGYYTTIRRAPDGRLVSVPYSLEYQGELTLIARLLEEAAALTRQPTLARFLTARAAAFRTNDYYESEIAWMELDASIEPTLGPYETYADGWFGAKAAFEAFITLKDDAETARLTSLGAELQGLEDALPIAPKFRNPKLGALAPIRVVNQIYASGDADHGIKTSAFNLPNDEAIIRQHGSKRTLIRNVIEAWFEKLVRPTAALALAPGDQRDVAFDAYFAYMLMHELMHGLGPNEIVVDGRATTARKELGDLFGTLEEAKADISGMWALQQLVGKGKLPRDLERTMYATYLATAFRAIGFGTAEAHGRGMAVQLNWLIDAGGVERRADGRYAIVPRKIKAAIAGLTRVIMTIQATGERAGAEALLERFGTVRPEMQDQLASIAASVPADIIPMSTTAAALLEAP